ncbi:hypothetical protein TRFO_24283 [Tritrichomonas foetus]|uniref:Secretory carrier membrane protein n=1 Tax=Tritrichomonas foetus TaxID=1144522 RepID=A0A1J4K8D2_9EUKA|nr:hypothetical protein TRFO_24283 [Tritrichomonas foetus]|eukprot:OHT07467.1 hypothetical protein TRFO_24283 [Tritrichomonas foetus]
MEETNPLDNYSPFDQTEEVKTISSPATSPTIGAEPDIDDAEIRAYEARLNILESQLNSQTEQINVARETGNAEPLPNWPKFYPLVHFDIEEVPEALRVFVSEAFYGWFIMAVAYSLNWLGCLTLIRAGNSTESPGSKIALASLYLFIVVPLALDLDAMSIYRVLKTDKPSTMTYLKIFIFLGITIFFEGMLALGLESSGSCGLITLINLFLDGHWFIGLISILVTGSLALACFTHYKLFKKLWAYYKGTSEGEDLEGNLKRTFAMAVVDYLK